MLEAVNKDYLELSNTSDIAEIGGRVEQIPITAPFEETLRIYQRDGIVCLTDAVSRDVVSGILDEFDSLMATTDMEHFFRGQTDKNPGESILGVLTKRRSEILARSPDLVGQLLTQPRLLELVKAHLTKYATSVLIHQVLSLEVLPGEVAQALHRDNALWPIPGNRIPLSLATMVPLENFTAETGATQVILGSHLWPEAGYIDPKDVEDRLSDGRGWNRYHSPAIDPDAELVSLPEFAPTFKTGLHYILPIVVLIWFLMIERKSPGLSAFWASALMLVILITQRPLKAMFRKIDTRELAEQMEQWLNEPVSDLRGALTEWADEREIEWE